MQALRHVHPRRTSTNTPSWAHNRRFCVVVSGWSTASAVHLRVPLNLALAVVCQEIVDIESGSADGWFLVESSVRSMPVVLVDPRRSEEHTSELQSLRH